MTHAVRASCGNGDDCGSSNTGSTPVVQTRSLARIALQSLTDHDALPVLGDAVLEAGWFDERVQQLVVHNVNVTGAKNYRRFMRQAAKPTPDWGRAVATVLLFESWPKHDLWKEPHPWPVVQRCKRPIDARGMSQILRNLYPQSRIENLAYETRVPFYAQLSTQAPGLNASMTLSPEALRLVPGQRRPA